MKWLSAFYLLLLGRLGTFGLAGTGAASAIHIQAVMVGIKRVETAGVHESGKIGVPHFLDLAASSANQVGVGQGNTFILRLHTLEHMAPEHTGVNQQFDSVIDCRTAHAKAVFLNELLQLLDREMPVYAHDTVQNGITLSCPAHSVHVKILVEFAYNGVVARSKIFDIWIGLHRCDKSTTFFAIKQRIGLRNN